MSTKTPKRAAAVVNEPIEIPSEDVAAGTTTMDPPAPAAEPAKIRDLATPSRKDSLDDVAIQIQPEQIPTPDQPQRQRYWLGILPGCPFGYVNVGGATFQQFSGAIDADDEGKIRNNPERGVIAALSDGERDAVIDGVARKVVRQRRFRMDVSTPGYTPEQSDEPLGRYLYMVPLGEQTPWDFRRMTPPPMVR